MNPIAVAAAIVVTGVVCFVAGVVVHRFVISEANAIHNRIAQSEISIKAHFNGAVEQIHGDIEKGRQDAANLLSKGAQKVAG